MAQTDPNRRFLIAGTSLGLIDDTFPPALPPNGVIFEQFNKYGITWKDYYSTLPTLGVFLPLLDDPVPPVRSRRDRPVLRRRSRGNAPVLQSGGAELREAVRGGSPGRAVRRPVPGEGRQRRHVRSRLAVDHADLDLRRARRLLRPRRPSGRRDPGRHPSDPRPRGPTGRLRPVRLPCARRRRQPLRPTRLRLPHGLRPHLDPQDRRGEVEPPRPHPARRQRQQPVRHGGPRGPSPRSSTPPVLPAPADPTPRTPA